MSDLWGKMRKNEEGDGLPDSRATANQSIPGEEPGEGGNSGRPFIILFVAFFIFLVFKFFKKNKVEQKSESDDETVNTHISRPPYKNIKTHNYKINRSLKSGNKSTTKTQKSADPKPRTTTKGKEDKENKGGDGEGEGN